MHSNSNSNSHCIAMCLFSPSGVRRQRTTLGSTRRDEYEYERLYGGKNFSTSGTLSGSSGPIQTRTIVNEPRSRGTEEPRSRAKHANMQTCNKQYKQYKQCKQAHAFKFQTFSFSFPSHHLVLFNNPNPPKLDPQSLHLQSSQQDLLCELTLPLTTQW